MELKEGRSYEVTGKVVKGSISHSGDELRFRIRDRDGTRRCRSLHGFGAGPVPDGREVIVSGELKGARSWPSATRS